MNVLKPQDVLALSKDETAKVELAVDFINGQIQSQMNSAEVTPAAFIVSSAKLSEALGGGNGVVGLTLRVKAEVVKNYADNGWKVTVEGDNINVAPKGVRKGGRPKMTAEEKAAAKTAREAKKAAANIPAPATAPDGTAPVQTTEAPAVTTEAQAPANDGKGKKGKKAA